MKMCIFSIVIDSKKKFYGSSYNCFPTGSNYKLYINIYNYNYNYQTMFTTVADSKKKFEGAEMQMSPLQVRFFSAY